jgi:hypothetical protein
VSKSDAHLLMEIHLKELKIPFVTECRFDVKRKWRFDFFLPKVNQPGFAIEIEGAVWTRGRHTRGKGYLGDMEKYNTAAVMGYRVLRFSTQQVLDGTARAFIEKHCI